MTSKPKEIKLNASPEARQFYISVLASLTTTLLITLVTAIMKRGETPEV